MSWTVIKTKSTTTVDADGDTNYLFTKNAKITITKGSSAGISSSLKRNTLILNNDITVKNSTEAAAYGIDGYCSYASTDVPSSDYFLTIRAADNASKLTVEVKTASSDTYAYGIIFAHECDSNYYGTLRIGMAGESFKKTIAVTASNNEGNTEAYGITSFKDITVDAKLATPVKVTANAKNGKACSWAFYALNLLKFNADIAANLTATTNGAKEAVASTIESENTLTVNGDIAGKIIATATGNESYAEAYALRSINKSITISGKITKAITAKATSKSIHATAYGIYAKNDVTLNNGINADITATANGKNETSYATSAYAVNGDKSVKITGDIAGKITATTTANGSSAKAYALYSNGGSITIFGKITKAITAKATSKSIHATAYGIYAKNDVTLNNGINADITATANGKNNVYAFAVSGTTSIKIIGDIASKITVNAMDTSTSTDKDAVTEACALWSFSGSISISGKITKAITAKATSKSIHAVAYGISANTDLTLNNGINADITATANGKNNVYAFAVSGTTSIKIIGDIASKITVNAMDTSTSTDKDAVTEACALWSFSGSISISGKITKAITIKATSKPSKTRAYAILANSGDITLGGIAADITVMATSGRYGTAYADGIYAKSNLTIHGDIAGKITVKGSAGQVCEVYGIYAKSSLTIDGDITKTITVTSKGKVSGIHANSLTLRSSLGTLSVTCKGSPASGWDIGGKLTVKSGFLTGKATVIGTTEATGLSVGKILDGGNKTNVVATLDITVKASRGAIGINLTDDATFTLKGSKITVKGGSAISAKKDSKIQDITLESSTLTGAVSLENGNDMLELTSKSKVLGDVDMGGGDDTVKIHSGSQVKGAITGAETLWLVLDNASAKSTVLWEGDIDQSAFVGNTLELDINNATIGVGKYTLMKDTDGKSDWTGASFEMKFDGTSKGEMLDYGAAKFFADSPYKYELKTDKSGKSLILAVTEK